MLSRLRCGLFCLCLVLLLAPMALAEVRMSLTIEGDLSEILAILRHLKAGGFGKHVREEEDPLKVFVHSLHKKGASASEQAPGAAPSPAEEESPPSMAFENPYVEPPLCAPGATVIMMVEVVDAENRIDTVSATLPRLEITTDLYDNGAHGDAIAGDGVWSTSFKLPENPRKGDYTIRFEAYDADGKPILLSNDAGETLALSTETALVITD